MHACRSTLEDPTIELSADTQYEVVGSRIATATRQDQLQIKVGDDLVWVTARLAENVTLAANEEPADMAIPDGSAADPIVSFPNAEPPAITSPAIEEAGPQKFRVVRVDELGNFKANVIRPTSLEAAQQYVAALKSPRLRVVAVQ